MDTIDLTGFGFANVAQAQAAATQVGADVVYDFNPGGVGAAAEVLTVQNATIAALADDILVIGMVGSDGEARHAASRTIASRTTA